MNKLTEQDRKRADATMNNTKMMECLASCTSSFIDNHPEKKLIHKDIMVELLATISVLEKNGFLTINHEEKGKGDT